MSFVLKRAGNKIRGVVLNRICVLVFFVLYRVGFQTPQGLTYTQILLEYSPTR